MIKSGDLSSVSSMVQHLRTICNHSSSLVYPSHTHTSWNHPWLPEVSPEPSRLISRLLYSSPLDRVSMDNMNLVFLKQELSTTGRLNLFTSLTLFLNFIWLLCFFFFFSAQRYLKCIFFLLDRRILKSNLFFPKALS